MTYKLIH